MAHNTPPNAPGLIGSLETCKILGIHRSTLVRQIAAGEIEPAGRLSNGMWLFDPVAVERVRAHRDAHPARRRGRKSRSLCERCAAEMNDAPTR